MKKCSQIMIGDLSQRFGAKTKDGFKIPPRQLQLVDFNLGISKMIADNDLWPHNKKTWLDGVYRSRKKTFWKQLRNSIIPRIHWSYTPKPLRLHWKRHMTIVSQQNINIIDSAIP